jgi:hypothetical protein
LRLSAEAGCIELLKWRCHLPNTLDSAGVACRLAERGFSTRLFDNWLIVLASADGSEIRLVPRTGRVQIRVGYATPKCDRPARAELVLAELERACAETIEG